MHIVIVAVAIKVGIVAGPFFFGYLDPVFDKILAGLFWVWVINLFNCMDGIDGIVGIETFAIGIGVFFIGLSNNLGYLGLILAAASAGFLIFNWHPAKIFLGDVGSIAIGFVLGWLLLSLISEGKWLAALILPAYFLCDSGITLTKRLIAWEKVWEAHRQHFYQFATQNGKSHSDVCKAVGVTNLILIALALLSTSGFIFGPLFGTLIVTIYLIFWMLRPVDQNS